MRKHALGAHVAHLQRQLNAHGASLEISGLFDDATEAAVVAWQRRAGLVVDGIAGPKTLSSLSGLSTGYLLKEADLVAAADRLGVPLAALKAVNQVESRGTGFLPDGRLVILYERHVAYRLAAEAELAPEVFWQKTPNVLNPQCGGYAGGAAEWSRLAAASQVIPRAIALSACSWGLFQIMGYHWQTLGYASIETFVAAMERDEASQLDAFTRFIEADPDLHKTLKGRKWPVFARSYNGPAYKDNLYDVKLARAYDRYSEAAA